MNGNGCFPIKRGAFPLTNGRPVVNRGALVVNRGLLVYFGRRDANHACSSGNRP